MECVDHTSGSSVGHRERIGNGHCRPRLAGLWVTSAEDGMRPLAEFAGASSMTHSAVKRREGGMPAAEPRSLAPFCAEGAHAKLRRRGAGPGGKLAELRRTPHKGAGWVLQNTRAVVLDTGPDEFDAAVKGTISQYQRRDSVFGYLGLSEQVVRGPNSGFASD